MGTSPFICSGEICIALIRHNFLQESPDTRELILPFIRSQRQNPSSCIGVINQPYPMDFAP